MAIPTSKLVEVFILILERFEGYPEDYMARLKVEAKEWSRATAIESLHPTLTGVRYLPRGKQKEIEGLLRASKLPSLTRLEADLMKKHRRVLSRGHIKNDEEARMIAEIRNGPDFDDLSAVEKKKISTMLREYERKRA